MANAPIYKSRLGSLTCAMWANEHTNDDGEPRVFHSVAIERNYKDKEGNWQTTGKLGGDDLGNAIALLQGAQQHLVKTG